VATTNAKQALSESKGLNDLFFTNPYGIAGLEIRDSLIAPPTISSPSDPRYGLIGGIFPLIIDGSLALPNGGSVRFRFVLGSFTFSISGSPPRIHAALSVDSFSAELDGNQLGVSLPRAPAVRVDLPTISSGGDIGLRLNSLD